MKKIILFLIALFVLLLFVNSVNAEVLVGGSSFGVNFDNNTTLPKFYWFPSGNLTVNTPLYLYNYEGESRPFTYLVYSVCSNVDFKVKISNGSYENYFAEDSAQVYDTGRECTASSFNYAGTFKYVQLQVGGYEDLDGTGYELVASSNILHISQDPNGGFMQVQNFYLSSDDLISSLVSDERLLDAIINLDLGIGNVNNNLNILNSSVQDTNDKLDNIEDSITSEEPPSNLGDLSDSAGWLPAGPVDSILTLPLTMFQSLSNNIGSTCTPLSIRLPFVDTNIELPCLYSIYEQIEGLSVWVNSIGIIASAFMLYSYLLKLYKWVDDTLTFRENNFNENWGGI